MSFVAGVSVNQYVVFRIDKEEYGVDIHYVMTIEKMANIARVPKTPSYIKGVINLRGEIIPVMDLRERFGLPQVEADDDTRIIILKIKDVSVGVIVDSVAEVIRLEEEDIESVNNFSSDLSLDYISGVGKLGNKLVTLLNFEKLIEEIKI